MKSYKKYYFIALFLLIVTGSAKSQQIIFQEKFDQNKGGKTAQNPSCVINAEGYADLTSVLGIPGEYMTPALDLADGASFISFNYKQNVSDGISGGLKVYYRTIYDEHWKLLAGFTHSNENWTPAKLFLPENNAKVLVLFSGPAAGISKLFLDDIQVMKYKSAMAASENHRVFVDTLFNISSSLLHIDVSEEQTAGLPEIEKTYKSPKVPVVCPANAIQEGETDCFTNYKDTTNSGCDTSLNRYTELYTCNGVVCGKSGTFIDHGAAKRDADWYKLVASGVSSISLKVVADFNVKVYVIDLSYGCLAPLYPGSDNTTPPGDTAIINIPSQGLSNLYFWVIPNINQTVPCGTNYVMIYKTTPVNTPATPIPALNPTCAPTQLTAVTNPTDYANYWQGTSCGLSTANPSTAPYPVTTAGTYYIRSIYTPLGCWTPCSSVNVTFSPPPVVTATALPTAICPGGHSALTGHNASTYTWMPGNLSGTSVNVYPTLPTTVYTVTGTALGCTGTSTVTVTVNTCIGINENEEMDNITVGPVPFSDELMIDCKQTRDIQVSLFTVENKLLSVQYFKGESSYLMKTGKLPAAVYFLKIESDKGAKTFRIVKQ